MCCKWTSSSFSSSFLFASLNHPPAPPFISDRHANNKDPWSIICQGKDKGSAPTPARCTSYLGGPNEHVERQQFGGEANAQASLQRSRTLVRSRTGAQGQESKQAGERDIGFENNRGMAYKAYATTLRTSETCVR